ncbi:MAG: hypothetical protein FWH24_05150, partial [Oscillospiraceae bacterium]|nr:hypothetical protein [Oscillospiraceae bacterium]
MKKITALIIFSAVLIFAFSLAVSAEAAPEGAYLKFSVDVDKSNEDGDLAFNYHIIAQNLGYVLQDGDTLEYDVWLSIEETGWGHIDGDIGGSNLRDRGFVDHEGTTFHTGQDISFSAFESWWHRSVRLGFSEEEANMEGIDAATEGKTLNSIQLSMHPAVSEDLYSGYALYDNIVITNNGEVKLVIFQNEGDLDPESFRSSHSRGSTGAVEVLTFTQEEMDGFAAAEAEKIRLAAEREAARIAAQEEREREAAEEAERAEAERLAAEAEAEAEESPAESGASDDGGGLSTGAIVGIIAGAVIAVV